jgi:hypothetical protein
VGQPEGRDLRLLLEHSLSVVKKTPGKGRS